MRRTTSSPDTGAATARVEVVSPPASVFLAQAAARMAAVRARILTAAPVKRCWSLFEASVRFYDRRGDTVSRLGRRSNCLASALADR
jgi:hypothetical protein